jgi:DNA-binding transcriptional ArsR family regulator
VSPYREAAPGPWDALGDPTRRAIFRRIAQGPCAVGEIASAMPISRPAVSQHLRVLKEAGRVSDRAKLRTDLDHFWTGALAAFKAVVEGTDKEKE